MYITSFSESDLADVKFPSKYADRNYMWSEPTQTTRFVARGTLRPGVHVTRKLKVRFSADFATFRAHVKEAIGRFMVFRSDQGKAAEAELEGLGVESLHKKLVDEKGRPGTFVVLDMQIYYVQDPSGEWMLNNFDLSDTWSWE